MYSQSKYTNLVTSFFRRQKTLPFGETISYRHATSSTWIRFLSFLIVGCLCYCPYSPPPIKKLNSTDGRSGCRMCVFRIWTLFTRLKQIAFQRLFELFTACRVQRQKLPQKKFQKPKMLVWSFHVVHVHVLINNQILLTSTKCCNFKVLCWVN